MRSIAYLMTQFYSRKRCWRVQLKFEFNIINIIFRKQISHLNCTLPLGNIHNLHLLHLVKLENKLYPGPLQPIYKQSCHLQNELESDKFQTLYCSTMKIVKMQCYYTRAKTVVCQSSLNTLVFMKNCQKLENKQVKLNFVHLWPVGQFWLP